MSHPSTWHPVARHASVFGITVVAVLLSILCALFIEPSYFLPLTAAVVACSWFFGRSGGVHATIVGAILADYFLIKPLHTFGFTKPASLLGLFIFVLIALLITWLTSLLRESQELQTSILQGMSDALVVTDRRGEIIYINPAAEALSGVSLAEARDQQMESAFRLRDEKTGEDRSGIVPRIIHSGTPLQPGAHTILTAKDGSEYSVEENAAPTRGRDGRINGAIVVLRNTTRRRQMQDQLTQSQKMEAIARLAGGVAGDFNNLLTVITGFGELLTSEMAAGNPLRYFAEEIIVAAERAAVLTRHLLAFGKGQSIPAKPHDLNALIKNMETMVGRILGPTVELILLTKARTRKIKIDPGQLEQMVVNLAMNARDAMPNGGKFELGTSDVEVRADTPGRLPDLAPGSYVLLTVTDTGVGMDSETRSRLFEPFFTTKLQGQGSGLGLAIVYGIVKQHNGHISVYSQPGSGTIFEVYFPPVKDAPDVEPKKGRGPRGSETILIADDEESVRKLVHHVLEAHGYEVIPARDGQEALELYEKHRERVDMVLTDVVMPNLDGYQLGQRISSLDPARKILFMSGYRDAHAGGSERARHILNKPFTPDVLLKQIREMLDSVDGA